MPGKGRPFKKGDENPKRKSPKRSGRQKGTPNAFRKADLSKLREHIENVMDEKIPGGLEGFVERLASHKNQGHLVSLLKEVTPKRVQLEADVPLLVIRDYTGKPKA